MSTQSDLEKCLPFLSSSWQALPPPVHLGQPKRALAITISRQTGSGANGIAECLGGLLQSVSAPDEPAWTVYDRNLVLQVLADHGMSPRLARFMPEDGIADLADVLDELLGVHPPAWTLVQRTSDTILRLANRGNVILIGRGAHIITRQLHHVFHVRLVGSLERRIQYYQDSRAVNRAEAVALIRREDRGRRRYLKKYFGHNVDDPVSYDLVLNTDCLTHQKAARLIADAALEHSRTRPPAAAVSSLPASDWQMQGQQSLVITSQTST